MICNREQMKQYALGTCLPMLEMAAERRLSRRPCEVVDVIGYIPSQLEEQFRPFWGITPILREQELFLTIRGKKVAVGAWLREVLVTATNPDSEYYWDAWRDSVGSFSFDFQNVTELAGLLVGCYFCRERTWDVMTEREQKQVADYIAAACRPMCEHVASNNHIWFPLLCLLVLERFGFVYPDTERFMQEGLQRLDQMYVGGGWYSDGEFGRIDYYEAWSMHSYPLLWCLIADPRSKDYEPRRTVYLGRTARFLQDYIHFFDVDGAHPPFGRSLAYRFAASCVFPLAVLAGVDVDPALAGEITRRNMSYFQEQTLTGSDGILPPGYLYASPALVDNYTSSGGPYWAAKTFLCLLLPDEHPFWRKAELPIDGKAFRMRPSDERLNFLVSGDRDSGITVFNNHFQYYQNGRYCNPFNDMAGYYNKFCYNSRAGFAISTRDNTSCDNMISLETADCSMTSHRWGFVDKGYDGQTMRSVHTPFSNDASTVIETWITPLAGSWHVRIHRVHLSQPYKVREGGYSIPLWDDYRESGAKGSGWFVKNRRLESAMITAATVPVYYAIRRPQPGLHMLAPFAAYPVYETELLPAGDYLFATVFGLSVSDAEMPTVMLEESKVTVCFRDLQYSIDCEIPCCMTCTGTVRNP